MLNFRAPPPSADHSCLDLIHRSAETVRNLQREGGPVEQQVQRVSTSGFAAVSRCICLTCKEVIAPRRMSKRRKNKKKKSGEKFKEADGSQITRKSQGVHIKVQSEGSNENWNHFVI